jgi:hypothetical protein
LVSEMPNLSDHQPRRLVSINGRVREIDPMPIEEQELGRGPITRGRITTVKLAADLQGSRRYSAA